MFFAIAPAVVAQEEESNRTWRAKEGGYSVEAKLLSVEGDSVVLEKAENGTRIKVKISVLIEEDQQYIEDFRARQDGDGEPDSPEPVEDPAPEDPAPEDPAPEDPAPSDPASEDPMPEDPQPTEPPANPQPVDPAPEQPSAPADSPEPSTPDENMSENSSTADSPAATNPVAETPVAPTQPADSGSTIDTGEAPMTEPAPVQPAEIGTSQPEDETESLEPIDTEIIPQIEITETELAALPNPLNTIAREVANPTSQESTLRALEQLDESWSDAHATTLIRILQKCSTSEDKFCRLDAIRMLGKYALQTNTQFILIRCDDESFEVRSAAFDLLMQSLDQRAIPALVERFAGRDREKIGQVLTAYGSVVESHLHRFLEHERPEVRLETGLILKRVGTVASVTVIQSAIETDEDPVVKLQLKTALKEIQKRAEAALQNQGD